MKQMLDLEDKVSLGKIVFDDNSQEVKSCSCLGQTCYRSLIVFLSQLFFSFCWTSLDAFGEFTFETLLNIQLFDWELCAVPQDTFYPHQGYEQVNFYKKSSLHFIGWYIRNRKIAAYFTIGKKMEHFNKVWQNLPFYQFSQPLYDNMQKEVEILEFVLGVNFEFIDSLKNNCTKYLLILGDSCENIFNSKAFVDIATARRHNYVETIYLVYSNWFQFTTFSNGVFSAVRYHYKYFAEIGKQFCLEVSFKVENTHHGFWVQENVQNSLIWEFFFETQLQWSHIFQKSRLVVFRLNDEITCLTTAFIFWTSNFDDGTCKKTCKVFPNWLFLWTLAIWMRRVQAIVEKFGK